MEASKYTVAAVVVDSKCKVSMKGDGSNRRSLEASKCQQRVVAVSTVTASVVDSYFATVPLLVSLLGSTEDELGCSRRDLRLGYFKAVTDVGAKIGSNIEFNDLTWRLGTATIVVDCIWISGLTEQ